MSNSSPSAILFHGPTAQGKSAEAAGLWGRVIGVFGHPRDGLDIETVRETVSVMGAPPIGDQRGSIVVGPVDILSQEGVADVFLKTLEDRHSKCPRPFLWAWDIGSVRSTIRSRCLLEWCPGRVQYDRAMLENAKSVIDASLSKSSAGVIEAFAEVRKTWKDDGEDFLRASVQILSGKTDAKRLALWASIRPLMYGSPTCDEAIAGFLQ